MLSNTGEKRISDKGVRTLFIPYRVEMGILVVKLNGMNAAEEKQIISACIKRIDSNKSVWLRNEVEICGIKMLNDKEERKVAVILESTGKYISEYTNEHGWFIKLNSNYELSESVKRTNRNQRVVIWISVGIAAFASWVAYMQYQHDINAKQPTIKIDTLRLHTSQRDTITIYTN